MPAKSKKQQRFAAMSRTAKGRRAIRARGGKPMGRKAAKKYSHKPRGGYRK